MVENGRSAIVVALAIATFPANAQRPTLSRPDSAVSVPIVRRDSVNVRLVDVELRSAVQALGQYLDRPVLFSGNGSARVTLETPRPVPRENVARLLRGLLESNSFELIEDSASGMYRARQKEVRPPAPVPQPGGTLAVPRQSGSTELFVIELRHARAPDIAQTVNALYGRAQFGSQEGRVTNLSAELRANQVPPLGYPAPGTQQGAATPRSMTLSGELTIVPDTRANALLIRANRPDYELIKQIVDRLDVRPLQVLIEVLIAEVRRDRSLSFGVDKNLPTSPVRGTPNTTVSGSQSPPTTGLGDFVIKVMGIGGVDLDATLRAAAGRGDVQIVSRPVLIAANNQQAEILVGSQRPFVQVARALPTDAAVRDQIVQYKDVGTRLTVTPTISSDGYVQLEVMQEVSNATSETAFNAPVISTRSVQTQLLIKDGQSVALGGLTDRQKDVSQTGIPILSSIPWIGGLFGRANRRSTETELFLFLTPRVIRTDEDASRLTQPLERRAGRIDP